MSLHRNYTLGLSAGVAALISVASANAQDIQTLNVALQSMGSRGSLETVENASTAGRKYQNSIFEQLIAMDFQDPDLRLKPGLATDWKWIDAKTLELTLRPGVKFHNGDTMTPNDVVFSFSDERFGLLPAQKAARDKGEATFDREDGTKGIVPPASVAAIRNSQLPTLDHVETAGEGKVRFIMKSATIDTEARLARVNHAAIISKRAFYEAADWNAWAQKPISTGPYKVESLEQGAVLHLVANNDYWGGKPPIAKLNFIVVPEAASRVNGLLSGEYHIISDVGPDQTAMIKGYPNFKVVGGPLAGVRFISLDINHGPLKNKLVRQALAHSIDRETIVKGLWDNQTSIPPGFQLKMLGDLFAADHKVPEYNPELAKRLLAEAGYKGEAITYKVHPDYYPNELTIAQFNLENLKKIGFNIDFSVIENPNDPAPDRMMQDLSQTVHFASPLALVSGFCPKGNYHNETKAGSGLWQNAEFDALCKVMTSSSDAAEVRKAFTRGLDILESEDPAVLVLHQNAILYGVRSDINWKPSAIFAMDFRPGSFSLNKSN